MNDSSPNSVAVVVLTLNEAGQIGRCLGRIPAPYAKFVVDSGSTDNTVAIAESLGATVLRNPWDGFSEQRNFALDNLSSYKWCLFIDADELYSAEFFEWLETFVDDATTDVVQISSRLYIGGEILRYAPGYPIYHPRLVRQSTVRFVPNSAGHGETVPAHLNAKFVDIPYEHHFLEAGLTQWMVKHIRLAAIEARAVPSEHGLLTWRTRVSNLFGANWIRAPLRFLYHYVATSGFRDGRAGRQYAFMYAWYELTKYLSRQQDKNPK